MVGVTRRATYSAAGQRRISPVAGQRKQRKSIGGIFSDGWRVIKHGVSHAAKAGTAIGKFAVQLGGALDQFGFAGGKELQDAGSFIDTAGGALGHLDRAFTGAERAGKQLVTNGEVDQNQLVDTIGGFAAAKGNISGLKNFLNKDKEMQSKNITAPGNIGLGPNTIELDRMRGGRHFSAPPQHRLPRQSRAEDAQPGRIGGRFNDVDMLLSDGKAEEQGLN
jgi:hypothetical protein